MKTYFVYNTFLFLFVMLIGISCTKPNTSTEHSEPNDGEVEISDAPEVEPIEVGAATVIEDDVVAIEEVPAPVTQVQIKIGDSRDEVIAQLGEPSGSMTVGRREILAYNGAKVVIEKGRVTALDKDFAEKQAQGKSRLDYVKSQKANGLVPYQGKWLTQAQYERIKSERAYKLKQQQKSNNENYLAEQRKQAQKAASGGDIKTIVDNGRRVHLSQVLADNKYTILYFYADWCPRCTVTGRSLSEYVRKNPDIALRKIDIVEWKTPITSQFKIKSLPQMRVFDKSGRMLGGTTSSHTVKSMISDDRQSS